MVFSVDDLSIELEEEERLRNKIRADHEKALEEAKEKLQKSRDEIQAEIQTEKNKIIQSLKNKGSKPLPPVPVPNLVGIKSGDPTDPDVREKRDKIKEVTDRAMVLDYVFCCRHLIPSGSCACPL
ncbi:UNVERIFIED_CONTAM: hypothetical protein K2H54_020769 [Gekko kuhli]